MRRSFRSSFPLLVLIVLLASCSKPDLARHIPSDATSVVSLNTGALSRKIAWSMIKGDDLFRRLKERVDDKKAANALNGIEDAGIRFSAISYAYTRTDTRYPGNSMVTILLPLSDAAKWDAYRKKVWPESGDMKAGDLRYARISSEYVAAWNKELLVVMNHALLEPDQSGERKPDSLTTYGTLNGVFSLKEDASIKSNKNFGALDASAHDLAFWINTEQAVNQSPDAGLGAAANITRSLWTGAYTTLSVDFENGRIDMRTSTVAGDSLRPLLEKFASSEVDGEMLRRTPGNNLDAVMGLHLSMDGLRNLADKLGLAPFADQYLQQMGTNMNNVLGALSGDLLVSVNDLSNVHIGNDAAATPPDAHVVLALKIGRKSAFDSLAALLVTQGLLQSGPQGFYAGDPANPSMVLQINDRYAALSNHKPSADAWLAGKPATEMPAPAQSAIGGHPFGMYANLGQMMQKISVDNANANDISILAEARKVFRDVSFYSEKMKGNSVDSKMELRFADESRNSLLQLAGFALTVDKASESKPEPFPVNDTAISTPIGVPAP